MTDFFATHFAFMSSPEGWAALITLVLMEVVLGIDNLIFISILTNKLPAEHRAEARRLGHRRGADHAAAPARDDLLDRRPDAAGLHGLRPRLLLARPDPDRRRPVPDLEGDQGDPPHRRPRRPQGRHGRSHDQRHARRGDLPDPAPRPRLLGRLDHHRGRHDRLSRDHVHRGHRRDHGDAGRRRAARGLHREEPDDRDAGARLPADDRHDADRRRPRLPCPEGLHLLRHGLLGTGRGTEHAVPATRQSRKSESAAQRTEGNQSERT